MSEINNLLNAQGNLPPHDNLNAINNDGEIINENLNKSQAEIQNKNLNLSKLDDSLIEEDPGLNKSMELPHPSLNQPINFLAKHKVEVGRDWSFSDAKGIREIAEHAVSKIKEQVKASSELDNFNKQVSTQVLNAIQGNPDGNKELLDLLQGFKQLMDALGKARNQLTKGIDDGSKSKDPLDAISLIRKTLRVFRYEIQSNLIKLNMQTQSMDMYESSLRDFQNMLTFGIDNHINRSDIIRIVQLENTITTLINAINTRLAVLDPAAQPITLPEKFTFQSTINDTLEVSHRTNDQIRAFQDTLSENAVLKDLLGDLAEKGGSRKIEFTAGVGALIGLGFPESLTAGLKAGFRFRLIGEVVADGPDRPIHVTFRFAGGGEAKLLGEVGDSNSAGGLKAEAGGTGLISSFSTRSYATLDDLINDASRCKLATTRSLGQAIWGSIGRIGRFFGNLGVKTFRALGRHSGEVMQTCKDYLESMKTRGIIHKLDGILAKKENPVVIAERGGYTGHIEGKIFAKLNVGGRLSKGSATISAAHQQDFSVKSQFFSPLAKVLKQEPVRNSLLGRLRPDPMNPFVRTNIPPKGTNLAEEYKQLIEQTKAHPPKTKNEWARFANKIRTLSIAAEVRCRDGELTREQADRLLTRFSNPEIKMDPDIFREYLMQGSGLAKPAKIRNSFNAEAKLTFYEQETKDLTKNLDGLTKVVAEAGVDTLRKQIGLDTKIMYRFSSEKPVHPNDPRPWENLVYTNHEMVVSGNIPFKAVVEIATRLKARQYEAPNAKSQNDPKDIAKDLFIDIGQKAGSKLGKDEARALLIAGAKEGTKAAVISWLSNPKNIDAILNFIEKHANEAFDKIINVLEWIATHPDKALAILDQAIAIKEGTKVLTAGDHLKVIKWQFADGNLETVSVATEDTTKLGFETNPLGVNFSIGLDLSYKVSQSVTDRTIVIKPSLKSLLGRTESHLYADKSLKSGHSESLKNWLAKNIIGIKNSLADLQSPESEALYNHALMNLGLDDELRNKLSDAWQRTKALTQNTPNHEIAKTVHDLLVTMTLAFRANLPNEA